MSSQPRKAGGVEPIYTGWVHSRKVGCRWRHCLLHNANRRMNTALKKGLECPSAIHLKAVSRPWRWKPIEVDLTACRQHPHPFPRRISYIFASQLAYLSDELGLYPKVVHLLPRRHEHCRRAGNRLKMDGMYERYSK